MSPPALSRFMNGFLTQGEVELGRLVLDTANPQKNFCRAANPTLTDADRSRREFDNIDSLVGAASASKFQLLLAKLLAIMASRSAKSTDTLKTAEAVSYQLYNVNERLETLLQEDRGKKWLEKYRGKSRIYLVVALHTVKDASVKLDANEAAAVDVKVKVPVAKAADAIVPGASVVPIAAAANIETSVAHSSSHEQSASFVAPGERIIAVGYQEVRFQSFLSSTADSARLAKTTVWKSFDTSRAADGADMVEATVGDIFDVAKGFKAKVEAEHIGSAGRFVILEGQVGA
ncbi:hypothetical protein B0T18DRAFT_429860 [Schizothecium vesticola]|uniref:Uncharacterized protein n=1 Tax=Schizothecium vesticola TaxID=314040 RepID=A0AA40EWS9_9PEZI|nr:hypothetical protein B0T18DRAFT_429860 [Schizothecium vesticola]